MTAPLPRLDVSFGVIVMGVCGSGKSTVGTLLAKRLGAPYLEGDDYHPAHNVEKMAAGIALEDDDRWPWLEALGQAIGSAAHREGCAVAACSALKCSYRDCLRSTAAVRMLIVYLKAAPGLLEERMATRSGHFMPASLLASQLATLEAPDESEGALCFDAAHPVPTLVAAIATAVAERTGWRLAERTQTMAPGNG